MVCVCVCMGCVCMSSVLYKSGTQYLKMCMCAWCVYKLGVACERHTVHADETCMYEVCV
jgi:hypothetical protein